MIHEEGGWPRDIDASEPEQKLRYMCAPRDDGGLARASGAAANAAGCCAGRATADSPFFFSPVAPAQQKGREGRGLREVHASTGRRDRALDAAELRDRESLRRVVTLRSVAIPIATCLIHPARAQDIYEDYFALSQSDHSMEAPSYKSTNVFKDPSPFKRCATSVRMHSPARSAEVIRAVFDGRVGGAHCTTIRGD